MKLEYVVHNATPTQQRVSAVVEGAQSTAIVDSLTVELTPVNPRHGSMTVNFIGGEREEAAAKFTPDKKISVSFD